MPGIFFMSGWSPNGLPRRVNLSSSALSKNPTSASSPVRFRRNEVVVGPREFIDGRSIDVGQGAFSRHRLEHEPDVADLDVFAQAQLAHPNIVPRLQLQGIVADQLEDGLAYRRFARTELSRHFADPQPLMRLRLPAHSAHRVGNGDAEADDILQAPDHAQSCVEIFRANVQRAGHDVLAGAAEMGIEHRRGHAR